MFSLNKKLMKLSQARQQFKLDNIIKTEGKKLFFVFFKNYRDKTPLSTS